MSVVAIAESLDRMGVDIAESVVERVRSEHLKPPSIAELYDVARQIRAEVTERDHPALSPGELVAGMPDDVREKWRAVQAGWAGAEERDVAAEDAEWQRRKAASLAGLRMEGTCLGTDKPPVLVDGRYVCPVCQIEVVDPRKAAKA